MAKSLKERFPIGSRWAVPENPDDQFVVVGHDGALVRVASPTATEVDGHLPEYLVDYEPYVEPTPLPDWEEFAAIESDGERTWGDTQAKATKSSDEYEYVAIVRVGCRGGEFFIERVDQ